MSGPVFSHYSFGVEITKCFSGGSVVKNLPAMQETWIQFLVRKVPWRRAWHPTAVFLPEESHGQRSLAGYSLYGHKELGTTEATVYVCVCIYIHILIILSTYVLYTNKREPIQ